jgi:hypothetical protein
MPLPQTEELHSTDVDGEHYAVLAMALHAIGGQVIVDERDLRVADSGGWVIRFAEVVDGNHRGCRITLELLE